MAWCLWQEVEIGERKRIKSPACSTRYTRQKQHMEHISEEGQGRVSGKRSLALLSHRFMHFKRIQEVIWRWCNHGIPPNCKHYWNPRRRHKKTMRFDHHSHATNHQIKVASWEMVGLPIFPATLPPLPPCLPCHQLPVWVCWPVWPCWLRVFGQPYGLGARIRKSPEKEWMTGWKIPSMNASMYQLWKLVIFQLVMWFSSQDFVSFLGGIV